MKRTRTVKKYLRTYFLLLLAAFSLMSCKKPGNKTTAPPVVPPVVTNEVDFWLTKADQSVKLQKQSTILGFGTQYNLYPTI